MNMESLKQTHHALLEQRSILSIQELLLKRRLFMVSSVFSRWYRRVQSQKDAESAANILSAQKTELDAKYDAMQSDLMNKLDSSHAETEEMKAERDRLTSELEKTQQHLRQTIEQKEAVELSLKEAKEEIAKGERTEALIAQLIRIWKDSVRASHHFLTEEDIQRLAPFAREAIRGIETLLVMYQGNRPVAFMGVENGKIEMLFVAPDSFGSGFGKRLVRIAIERHRARYVDVNEQNPEAEGFYRHLGFSVFERTETDEQGNPFPILKMAYKNKSN